MLAFQASVIQASPVFFDKEKTLEKVGDYIRQASIEKTQLMLFPEVFIPGYPRGLIFLTAEIDHPEIIKAKMDFDVIGHYTRPDLFQFKWTKQP